MKRKTLALGVISLGIILAVMVSAKPEEVFILYITLYKNDSVDLHNFELTEGKVNVYPSSGNYTLKLVSSGGESLFSAEIPINFITFVEWQDEETGDMRGEMVKLEKLKKLWRLPYFSKAERIELYHQGKLIFSLNIAEELCTQDDKCPEYCQDKGDPDCEVETTTTATSTTIIPPTLPRITTSFPKTTTSIIPESTTTTLRPTEEGYLNYLPQLILGVIILAGIIFLLYRAKKGGERVEKRQEEERMKEWVKKKLKEGESPEVLKKGLEREGYNPNWVDEVEGKLW